MPGCAIVQEVDVNNRAEQGSQQGQSSPVLTRGSRGMFATRTASSVVKMDDGASMGCCGGADVEACHPSLQGILSLT